MSTMQIEAIKAKEQYKQEILQKQNSNTSEELANAATSTTSEQQKSKKSKKSKSKKKSGNAAVGAGDSKTATPSLGANDNIIIAKASKSKKAANGTIKGHSGSGTLTSSTALTSLVIFLLMMAINVVLIYMIMFKNPEIAERLVEAIPHQYRDWILTKTEIFRLRVTDWITQFRTPPEEH